MRFSRWQVWLRWPSKIAIISGVVGVFFLALGMPSVEIIEKVISHHEKNQRGFISDPLPVDSTANPISRKTLISYLSRHTEAHSINQVLDLLRAPWPDSERSLSMRLAPHDPSSETRRLFDTHHEVFFVGELQHATIKIFHRIEPEPELADEIFAGWTSLLESSLPKERESIFSQLRARGGSIYVLHDDGTVRLVGPSVMFHELASRKLTPVAALPAEAFGSYTSPGTTLDLSAAIPDFLSVTLDATGGLLIQKLRNYIPGYDPDYPFVTVELIAANEPQLAFIFPLEIPLSSQTQASSQSSSEKITASIQLSTSSSSPGSSPSTSSSSYSSDSSIVSGSAVSSDIPSGNSTGDSASSDLDPCEALISQDATIAQQLTDSSRIIADCRQVFPYGEGCPGYTDALNSYLEATVACHDISRDISYNECALGSACEEAKNSSEDLLQSANSSSSSEGPNASSESASDISASGEESSSQISLSESIGESSSEPYDSSSIWSETSEPTTEPSHSSLDISSDNSSSPTSDSSSSSDGSIISESAVSSDTSSSSSESSSSSSESSTDSSDSSSISSESSYSTESSSSSSDSISESSSSSSSTCGDLKQKDKDLAVKFPGATDRLIECWKKNDPAVTEGCADELNHLSAACAANDQKMAQHNCSGGGLCSKADADSAKRLQDSQKSSGSSHSSSDISSDNSSSPTSDSSSSSDGSIISESAVSSSSSSESSTSTSNSSSSTESSFSTSDSSSSSDGSIISDPTVSSDTSWSSNESSTSTGDSSSESSPSSESSDSSDTSWTSSDSSSDTSSESSSSSSSDCEADVGGPCSTSEGCDGLCSPDGSCGLPDGELCCQGENYAPSSGEKCCSKDDQSKVVKPSQECAFKGDNCCSGCTANGGGTYCNIDTGTCEPRKVICVGLVVHTEAQFSGFAKFCAKVNNLFSLCSSGLDSVKHEDVFKGEVSKWLENQDGCDTKQGPDVVDSFAVDFSQYNPDPEIYDVRFRIVGHGSPQSGHSAVQSCIDYLQSSECPKNCAMEGDFGPSCKIFEDYKDMIEEMRTCPPGVKLKLTANVNSGWFACSGSVKEMQTPLTIDFGSISWSPGAKCSEIKCAGCSPSPIPCIDNAGGTSYVRCPGEFEKPVSADPNTCYACPQSNTSSGSSESSTSTSNS